MSKTEVRPKKIDKLLEEIDEQTLVVPEFQREYKWRFSHVKKLFASLVKDNPIGAVCIWKTSEQVPLRNTEPMTSNNEYNIILDGQQRLTSLYYLFRGKNPPYYAKEEQFYERRILLIFLQTN